MKTLLIQQATLVDPQSPHHLQICDIYIENGTITEIGQLSSHSADEVLSLENCHVSPGWMDPLVTIGSPGYEERETLANGIQTALRSGFTTIGLQPVSDPIIDHRAAVGHLIQETQNQTLEVLPLGSLSKGQNGEQLAALYEMFEAGAVGFTDVKKSIANPNLLKIALQYCRNFDGLVFSHPQDTHLSTNGVMHEGETSANLGLVGIPSVAETAQIARDIALLEYTGGRLHIPFVSSAESLELIQKAKEKGLNISCSVGLAHLWFCDEDLHDFDSDFKVFPPLRSASDREALKKGLISGVIDCVSAMHEPINIENKAVEFEHALDGSIGLEAMFGILTQLFPLEKCVQFLCRGRNIYGLENPSLIEGASANLTLFDPDFTWKLSTTDLYSTSKNCMFVDQPMRGRVYGVFNQNTLIHNFE